MLSLHVQRYTAVEDNKVASQRPDVKTLYIFLKILPCNYRVLLKYDQLFLFPPSVPEMCDVSYSVLTHYKYDGAGSNVSSIFMVYSTVFTFY